MTREPPCSLHIVLAWLVVPEPLMILLVHRQALNLMLDGCIWIVEAPADLVLKHLLGLIVEVNRTREVPAVSRMPIHTYVGFTSEILQV